MPQVAAVMNAHFVNIKVDREERPDLDQIYQTAHALLTRRSRRLAADDVPDARRRAVLRRHLFPARRARYGLPGFLDLLPRVAAAYRERGADDRRAGCAAPGGAREPRARARRTRARCPSARRAAALAELERRFDPEHGGFGAAPKFPHAADLELCLREHARSGDADALRDGPRHARADGRRRHPRPARRRVLPLQRRCRVVDPAFREDALRQRAAARRCTPTSRA